MLINISNHPIDKWHEKQRSAARQYGELRDIPFPQVAPKASTTEIDKMAAEYVAKIKEVGTKEKVVIHIMGEMTFCFALVNMLKAAGYRCIAATAERKVKDLGDGKKEVTFDFVQFREY